MKVTHRSSLNFNALTWAERRPSAELMAQSLRSKGVTIADTEIASIGGNLARLDALHQLDFAGGKTAFEHIEGLASAQTIKNGAPSAPLAANLFSLAGSVRSGAFYGNKCYARTNHSIYSKHHAGEMSRIIGDLAAKGEVTLADGTQVKWNPETLRADTSTVDRLWGALNHYLKEKKLPANRELYETDDYASKGEMSNLTSRLTGVRFVNAAGSDAMPHLNDIIDRFGPVLAEYDNHGGSVAKIRANVTLSQEGGGVDLMPRRDLGYVVVPEQFAKERGIPVIEYLDSEPQGYAKPVKPTVLAEPAVFVSPDDVKKSEP